MPPMLHLSCKAPSCPQSTGSYGESTWYVLADLCSPHPASSFLKSLCPKVFNPPAPDAPTESPLRFGILGAANIAPVGIVLPVKNHPDAVLKAIAARDQGRADAFAKKHSIPKSYGGPGAYQSLRVTKFHQS